MKINMALAAIVLAALFVPEVYGQDPNPSPSPAAPEPVTDKAKSETATQAPAAAAPTPETDLWHRETLTGDWGGDRERLKNEGLEIDMKLSSFYQGIASGGTRHQSVYTGQFDLLMKLDFGKMSKKWQWWSAEIETEWRFGGPLLLGTGGVNFVNTATAIPGTNGSVGSVTALNFTRIIPKDLAKGDLYVVGFGRYNLVAMIDEDFFAGDGIDRFMNLAQIGPLTVLREVPFITNGGTFATVKGGEPRFTLAVIDPNDHSVDSGLDDLFADGVTFAPAYNIPTKYWGKTAKHTIGGAVTTKKYTPFDFIRGIIIPGPPINPVQPKRGSWNINYVFRQYIVERGKKDGWGFFAQAAIANKNTSPITKFLDIGIGGNGLFKSRERDEFGVAYAYTGLSSVLTDNIDLLTQGGRNFRPEHQFEMFYNWHITPWLQLTGDLQVIRGVRPIANTAVVPGGRLVMVF